MPGIIDNPRACLSTGLALAALLLIGSLLASETDRVGLIAFLLRFTHVLAAMVWIGLIVFVNFVQLVALKEADEAARAVLDSAIVPRVAWWFRHASTLTVLSGLVLLVFSGYLLPSLIYGSSVFIPAAKAVALWTAVLGALAMWMFVHMYIWPNMQVVLGLRRGDGEAKAKARARVILFARLNLIIAMPVALGMIAAAHLY
ncbi:MAG TPA: hypothetical protein VFR19_11850 [Hyphomicrobiaceae bacterium]|jgi:uncharacterized membrane protein|nr:hypothetical protein [Hyphomicrobiaceae bacterium]